MCAALKYRGLSSRIACTLTTKAIDLQIKKCTPLQIAKRNCHVCFAAVVGAVTFLPGLRHTVEYRVHMNNAGQHDGILEA